MQTAKHSKHSNRRRVVVHRREELPVKGQPELPRRAAIDVLPDDVLIDVFDFCLECPWHGLEAWQNLVHVCRRWRQLVFASPRRLNLRLLYKARRPVKKLLDIWPALPIVVEGGSKSFRQGITNIDAALKHNDRICEITIWSIPSPLLESFASIKEPFPVLTNLDLSARRDSAPVLPDSFLGGSAPQLHKLRLGAIPFPGLPKLLLSAHHLVHLHLWNIPDSGFISSAEMVTCLSSLASLESLELEFSHPDQTNRHRPPLTHTVLPSLTSFSFEGDSEYLEDVVARIDTPLLKILYIVFFNQPVFDTPLLRSFISRTEAFNAFPRAVILFFSRYVEVRLFQDMWPEDHKSVLVQLRISCKRLDEQHSSMVWLCNSSLPPFPTLERLNMCVQTRWADGTDDAPWVEVLRPFITVKSLYIGKKFASRVASALQELSRREGATGVLPALQNIFVPSSEPVLQAISEFVAARRLFGHPVTVHDRA